MRTISLVLLSWFTACAPPEGRLTTGDVPNLAERAAALSMVWSEAKYNFAFFDQVPEVDWDARYLEFLPQILAADDFVEFYRTLERFTAALADGHTGVFLSGPTALNEHVDRPPIDLAMTEGRPVIANVEAVLSERAPIGSVVLAVDSRRAESILVEDVEPLVSASTDHGRRWLAILRMLEGPTGSTVRLTIEAPDGYVRDVVTVRDQASRGDDIEWAIPKTRRPTVEFRWLDEESGIAYVALNNFGRSDNLEAFQAIWPELRGARTLVLDLRKNGGGSSAQFLPILRHFTNVRLEGPAVRSRMNVSARRAWGSQGWDKYESYAVGDAWLDETELTWSTSAEDRNPAPSGQRLVVPTALLTGVNTASAAETFLIFADPLAHMFRVGEPTFGSSGQPLVFQLPGDIGARICSVRETWPDGSDYVGVGILPHIGVTPTIEDVRAGRDVVLARAVAELRSRL